MEKLLTKIDSLIEEYTPSLVEDTIRLVNIKSVLGEPSPNAPFGTGPRAVQDEFLKMASGIGLSTKDYGVGFVSGAMGDGKIDLGIWLHGDVVPEGTGWKFEPYNAVQYKDCIIGRGANDNKGQIAAIFNLFKIFKELGIALRYNPAIFVGSNEETGMKDLVGDPEMGIKGFLDLYNPPRLSLVSDGPFPIGYGGKGSVQITFRSKSPLTSFTFEAGTPADTGGATAIFDNAIIPEHLEGCTVSNGEKTRVYSFSPPRHGARPVPGGNMITVLSSALLSTNALTESEKQSLEFFRILSKDIYGEEMGISCDHAEMGKLTVFVKEIRTVNSYAEVTLNIRYPLGISCDKIVGDALAFAMDYGFELHLYKKGTSPYIMPKEGQVFNLLYETAKDVMCEECSPVVLSGGTYAHRLPNAYVYGLNGNLPPDDFAPGVGLSHGVDEAVSLTRLKRGMRIYARALLALNDIEF